LQLLVLALWILKVHFSFFSLASSDDDYLKQGILLLCVRINITNTGYKHKKELAELVEKSEDLGSVLFQFLITVLQYACTHI